MCGLRALRIQRAVAAVIDRGRGFWKIFNWYYWLARARARVWKVWCLVEVVLACLS